MSKRGLTVIEFMVAVAITSMLAALIIPVLIKAHALSEEEQAAANRARLAKVPIQTEGIKYSTVELPEPAAQIEITAKIQRERPVFVVIQCPHCGKPVKINLKEEWEQP